MGINSWLKVSFLIALTAPANAAYRTNFNPTSQQVISSAPSASSTLHSGTAVIMYGAEAVYHIDAGNKFSAGDVVKPTIRPDTSSSAGKVYFPNGAGASMPNANISPTSTTKIKIKPSVGVPIVGVGSKLKDALKGVGRSISLPALMANVAISAAVAGVGWVMSDDQTKLQRKQDTLDNIPIPAIAEGIDPMSVCSTYRSSQTLNKVIVVRFNGSTFATTVTPSGPDGSFVGPPGYTYINNCTADYLGYEHVSGRWPKLSKKLINPETIVHNAVDLMDADFNALDTWLAGSATAAMLTDIIKATCNGSLNPTACFSELEDRSRRNMSGPNAMPGPSFSTTSTYTKPDGQPGTKTTNSTTNYTFNYGNTYFDTNTTTTTTTTIDGVETSKDISTDTSPVTDPDPNVEPEKPKEEEEKAYTFTDPALPVVTPFYTQKYPNGLSGVWDEAKSGFTNSPFIGFLNSFIPSWGGSCPSWSMSFAIGSLGNFGSIGFGDLCYVFAFVKACMMLGAVFFSRSAIFGG